MSKQQERERIRQEVTAEFQIQAQNFVTEQITQARQQMAADFETQINVRVMEAQ